MNRLETTLLKSKENNPDLVPYIDVFMQLDEKGKKEITGIVNELTQKISKMGQLSAFELVAKMSIKIAGGITE
jgi:hypothetical protein